MQDDFVAFQHIMREFEHDEEWGGKGPQEQMNAVLERVDQAQRAGKPIVSPSAWDDRPLTRAQVYRAFGYYE